MWLVVAAVVPAVEATSQLVHVPSSATASGITTDAQVAQMQVGTLRVTASPAKTRSRERVAQAVGRVAAAVHAVETTSQLVHVPSSATASGITTDAQVVQMQVGTLRVTASPALTRSREHASEMVGRGVARADAEQGARRESGRATRAVWQLSRWEKSRGTSVSLSSTSCGYRGNGVVWMAGRLVGVGIGR